MDNQFRKEERGRQTGGGDMQVADQNYRNQEDKSSQKTGLYDADRLSRPANRVPEPGRL